MRKVWKFLGYIIYMDAKTNHLISAAHARGDKKNITVVTTNFIELGADRSFDTFCLLNVLTTSASYPQNWIVVHSLQIPCLMDGNAHSKLHFSVLGKVTLLVIVITWSHWMFLWSFSISIKNTINWRVCSHKHPWIDNYYASSCTHVLKLVVSVSRPAIVSLFAWLTRSALVKLHKRSKFNCRWS